jgi:hypothetical protein
MPLGRPLGHPGDTRTQLAILNAALEYGADMTTPGSEAFLSYHWGEDDSWKDRATMIGQSSDGIAPPPTGGDDRAERDETPMWDRPGDEELWRASRSPSGA